jgi:DNA-binding CsgD family transcriptional regulator
VARNDAQLKMWLELVGEILKQPLGMSSREQSQLLELLTQSFDGACSTRNRVSATWENQVLDLWPRNYVPEEPPGEYDSFEQPLLRWYALTGETAPQSVGRVPDAVASSSLKQTWEEVARPFGINHQLSIPLQIGGGDHNAYLIARPDRDFTEQELDLAKVLQPILTGLALYVGLAPANVHASVQGAAQGLTLREMAVLTLLSKGLTAENLARRLGISPRTAGKHLEHIYRKLDVGDRLMAVQRAYEMGLIMASPDSFQSRILQPGPGEGRQTDETTGANQIP